MNENGEPAKSFVENELKKNQKYAETIDNSKERLPIYMIATSPKDTAELNYLGRNKKCLIHFNHTIHTKSNSFFVALT